MHLLGDLANSDVIMNNPLFLGTYPGNTEPMLQAEIGLIKNFCKY